ncbi:MAG: 3'-5' exonuclease [Aquificaceae bacterium]|nr:3'-5' exonuclease [Aquificaceae bacterium]MDW8095834.1 3'-5' exonuclease [Aquificaceae bacterium]
MTGLKGWLLSKLKPEKSGIAWEVERETSVQDACFVVFDTETTGIDLKKDEPISIGAVKIEKLRIDLSKSFYALIKPTKSYGESIKVHGITPQDLEKAKDRREVCMEFLDYAKGCILSGYFVHLDVAMLKKLTKESCNEQPNFRTLDLLDMLERKDNIPTMEELLKSNKMPVSNLHNALEDAYMTALLLLKFLKEGRYSKVKDIPLKTL